MPATQSNDRFCKTLMTLTMLDYSDPYIVAWDMEDSKGGLKGGGSHFAKITSSLDYINDEERRKQPGFDDELVFIIDSYDIWFQLPQEVLLSRYEAIVREENERVAHRMGRAWKEEDISSPIIFGGGKRCCPNQIQTVSCYPVPESPLPDDIHGGATDTMMGRNEWSSRRTRYLTAGYVIGPVGKMRAALERAKQRLEECISRTNAWFDSGNHKSDHCYQGSDQSIFVEMFGEQEFHREVMRRHHRTFYDDWLDKIIPGRAGAKPPPTEIMGAPVLDRLNPDFPHQEFDPTYLPDKPYEFGISIDYWSLLGHQTSNADADGRYIRHNKPLGPQVGPQRMFDCVAKAPMPEDLPRKGGVLDLLPGHKESWETLPLYSEICVGTVPVMIHHNNINKKHIENDWDQPWWHGYSRQLIEKRREQGATLFTKGIMTDTGKAMKWDQLCPTEYDEELFRDIGEKQTKKVIGNQKDEEDP